MKTKEQLIEDLRIAEENIKLDLIKKNPKLLPSLKEKIAELKQQIESYEDVEPKVEKPKVEKPIAIEEPKVEKPKVEKPKAEKPAKEVKPKVEKPKAEKPAKKERQKVDTGDFNIGDKVSYIERATKSEVKGEITRAGMFKGDVVVLVVSKEVPKGKWRGLHQLKKI